MNAVNDQVAGIGAVVVPGTVCDSPYILDTMLNLDAGPKPEMIATDTASYSDIVFGLFRMLGYRFSPRIADLSDQRFWRVTLPGAPDGTFVPEPAQSDRPKTAPGTGAKFFFWRPVHHARVGLVPPTPQACTQARRTASHSHRQDRPVSRPLEGPVPV
jgi:Tn3 transposase DDE domain